MKYIAAIAFAAGTLAGCGTLETQPAPTVTVQQPAQPAPTVTVTARPSSPTETSTGMSQEESSQVRSLALELAWDRMDYTAQQNICLLYEQMPEYAWSQFADSDTGLTRAEFDSFFLSVC